ncbi:MAG: HAD family phosphatase [Bacteriovoracaceae bacterium]|nr:HAD family phosphatase [Bacteriovoracaceae bacterium]
MEVFTQFPTLSALKPLQPSLRGVLFDMDGTLLQTEELHADVLREMAIDYKISPPFPPQELQERLKGMADAQVWKMAQDWKGFPSQLSVEDFIHDKNNRLIQLIPKVPLSSWCSEKMIHFLKEAKKEDILLAIVTSSERVITDQLIKHGDLKKYFDLIITLQDVVLPKPNPGPYLKAMQLLNLGPRDTLIFEDSITGMTAAKATGARVIEAKWWD